MSFPHPEITLIIKHAIRKATIRNVMSASTSFQQTLLVLLNIGHTHSGTSIIALHMNMIILLAVVAVSEWSHKGQDILPLRMEGSSA
jgi:hypothetical protein